MLLETHEFFLFPNLARNFSNEHSSSGVRPTTMQNAPTKYNYFEPNNHITARATMSPGVLDLTTYRPVILFVTAPWQVRTI